MNKKTDAIFNLLLIMLLLTLKLLMSSNPYAKATENSFGPKVFRVNFFGKEMGVAEQLTLETAKEWTTRSHNKLVVDINLTAYWNNITKISTRLLVVRVEKNTGGQWKSIGVDLNAF